MKNPYLSLIFIVVISFSAKAETWTGSTSTDWNIASNWTPATVPNATSTVTIPTFGITNYPQLSSSVTIARIIMNSGAKLDVNGFAVTILGGGGHNVFSTDTIINSAAGTNIVFNIAAGSGYSTRISRCEFTDTVVFNLTGTAAFYEGYNSIPNRFNNEVTYHVNGSLDFYTSYISETIYMEGMTVNRSVTGQSYVLQDGGSIANNFSFVNNVGGETRIGSAGNVTLINGTIDVTLIDSAPQPFLMRKIKNLTTGGTINVQGSRGFTVQDDTLLVSSLSLSEYTGGTYGYFYYNDIAGDVNITADTSYSSGYYTIVRGSVLTGTTTFSNPCSNAFYETFTASGGNIYNGNLIVNGNGSGTIDLGFAAPSTFNGDVTVNRTVGGNTAIFKNGGSVNGNFFYNNNSSGSSDIGNFSTATNISGTINIDMALSTPGRFRLYSIKNQTGGGTISANNTLGFDVQKDTLALDTISITNYEGAAFANFYDNQITGDVITSSDSNYTGGYTTRIRRNTVTGNSQFIINSTNALNESNSLNASNTFNGNTSFVANGSGEIRLGWNDTSTYNGNLSITRTVAGTSTIFGSGANVNGDFSYTNTAGGNTYLGYAGYPTLITGTIDMTADFATPDIFQVYRFTNQTSGGVIDIKGTRGFNFRDDTLNVASLSLTEYTGAAYARMYRNEIVGDVTISDDSTYAGGYNTDLYDNNITGNTIANLNSSNNFFSDYGGSTGNVFNGNTIFNANGTGTLRVSAWNGSTFNGDLTINRTKDGQTRVFESGGVVNGDFLLNCTATSAVYLGTLVDSTLISGTVDIAVTDTVPAIFRMRRIINYTTGGIIDIQGSRGGEIINDTLKVASLSMTGYGGTNYASIEENEIEGDVTLSTDSSYAGGYYTSIRSNKIIGNTTIINNGTNLVYDADGSDNGNEYMGNLNLTKGQGNIQIGNNDTTSVSGDLILNSSSGIELRSVRFNGNTNAVIDQLGSQPIVIDDIIMDKTNADITLNKPVSIDDNALFQGGRILSTATYKLTFEDNATATVTVPSSHVDGIVSKIGNDAFVFPIGKNNKYAPLGISAPASNTDEFTAEYFEAMPHTSGFDSIMKDASIDHISQNEYWICDRTVGTSDVAVTLGWDSARSGIVNNLGDLLVCRWDGTSWKNEGQASNTGTFSKGTVTSNTVTSFSPFTLGSSTANNPLPLPLLKFDVTKENRKARLHWTTEDEKDVLEFVVERSTEGTHFETLDNISAKGNTTGSTSYKTIDARPNDGLNYYRLRTVNQDGKFSFSEIRVLNFSKELQATLYPNPVKNVLHINADYELQAIEVYDVSGKLILRTEDKNLTKINMSSFDKGVYIIKLHGAEEEEMFKIIKR